MIAFGARESEHYPDHVDIDERTIPKVTKNTPRSQNKAQNLSHNTLSLRTNRPTIHAKNRIGLVLKLENENAWADGPLDSIANKSTEHDHLLLENGDE